MTLQEMLAERPMSKKQNWIDDVFMSREKAEEWLFMARQRGFSGARIVERTLSAAGTSVGVFVGVHQVDAD